MFVTRPALARPALAILLAAACAQATLRLAAAPAHGLDLAGMDRAVAPGDNFFNYANGAWLKKAKIPADRRSAGTAESLSDLTNERTAALIKGAARHGKKTVPEAQLIGDYYRSFMDEGAIEAKALLPLQPTLDRLAGIQDRPALAQALGRALRADVDVLNATNLHTDNLFGLWVAQDLDDPTRYTPFLLQGGLGLPDRDYYLDPAPPMQAIRTQYLAHIARVLGLARLPEAQAKAARILALEAKLAEVHGPRSEAMDVLKGNNHWTRSDFDSKAPGLDWSAYFAAAGLGAQTDFVVWQPAAFQGISALVASEPLETWKDYLAFRALEHACDYLPKAFVKEGFGFYGKVLSGTPQLRDRWKRGVDATNRALGEAVGKLYVAQYFPPAEKARAQAMVANILAAFSRRIDQLAWMAPETRQEAKAKLATLKVGVGYPDTWRDYSGLRILPGDAFGNAERAELFELKRNLDKLGHPVDRSEWVMNPQLVNAVNLPVMNALNFPAAILQPPYLDPRRPLAMDYAATGATIGHEISHSFDDQGALFDSTGRLNNWWTPDDKDHFEAASAMLVKQFDGYQPLPGLAVNGRQTLGENIADVAGLACAYDAYRLALGQEEPKRTGGFSADQMFFISFAQSWRHKRREPALRQQLLTDGHAPAACRALTVRNLDAWYAAFAVKPGEALFLAPGERVKIW